MDPFLPQTIYDFPYVSRSTVLSVRYLDNYCIVLGDVYSVLTLSWKVVSLCALRIDGDRRFETRGEDGVVNELEQVYWNNAYAW